MLAACSDTAICSAKIAARISALLSLIAEALTGPRPLACNPITGLVLKPFLALRRVRCVRPLPLCRPFWLRAAAVVSSCAAALLTGATCHKSGAGMEPYPASVQGT